MATGRIVFDYECIGDAERSRVGEDPIEGLGEHRVDPVEAELIEPLECPRQLLQRDVRRRVVEMPLGRPAACSGGGEWGTLRGRSVRVGEVVELRESLVKHSSSQAQ